MDLDPPPQVLPQDRLLVIAVHPDDESLATGGLLQRARAVGAAARVVFLTDGENNPWPQRYLERRWRLGESDRTRWAQRRRVEALAALDRLGYAAADTEFLGWPDTRLGEVIRRASDQAAAVLAELIGDWEPTLLAYPAAEDLHPDHSAAHVLVRLALHRRRRRAGPGASPPREWLYLVHSLDGQAGGRPVRLRLDPAEAAAKRQAILCHDTQLALSRRRFLAFAGQSETFFVRAGEHAGDDPETDPARPPAAGPPHAVREVRRHRQQLLVRFGPGEIDHWLGRPALWLVMEHPRVGSLRWLVHLPRRAGWAPVHDGASGTRLGCGSVAVAAGGTELRLPMAVDLWPLELVFVKLRQPTLFYDPSGWREFALAGPPAAESPVPAPAATARPAALRELPAASPRA